MNAVPPGTGWEDPVAYAAMERYGRAGLAWEVLRRDPDYRDAFAALDGQLPVSDSFTTRWGLHFR